VGEKKLRAVSDASPPAARVEGEEGKRSDPGTPGTRAAGAAAGQTPTPDPEVPQKAKRRRFSAAYKLKILKRTDAMEGTGEIGAMLRREGLYWSMLSRWRQQREAGSLRGLKPKKRGPKGKKSDPLAMENKRLRREMALLHGKLRQAELVIEIQKKVSELLGIPQSKGESAAMR